MTDLFVDRIFQRTVRQWRYSGGHSVCECSICMLSGTPKAVMSHCDVHHHRERRDPIVVLYYKSKARAKKSI
jgi:hypothetical protein